MNVQRLNVIGLMSGSSLDGVDIAHVSFVYSIDPTLKIQEWEITNAETLPYSSETLNKLKEAVNYNGKELSKFDRELGKVYGDMINYFCKANNVRPDLIASHGHTLFHSPKEGYTLQIGHPASIAAVTNITTIGDFRSTDVAAGGEGAPFAPIVDQYLFSQYNVCINFGGIINLTVQASDQPEAFDICPGNQILNFLAEKEGKLYDEGGKIARSGKLNKKLFDTLKVWDYFDKEWPKSLDNNQIKHSFIPMLEDFDCPLEDKMHTAVKLISYLIKKELGKFSKEWNLNVLVTGGGAHNSFLVETLKAEIPEVNITVPDKKIVDFKEALLMALMGLLRYLNSVNVISSVTGSNVNQSAGGVYLGTQKIK